jgi:hypothetical protein
MNKFLGPCLLFAGVCLLAGAAVGVVDWAACLGGSGGQACRAPRSEAMAALSGAANVALGVALQEWREGP